MAHVLGQNQYGKAETRVVRVVRDGPRHTVRDLNVSVALSGDLDDVHLTGSNAHCLPTDTVKNTCYAFAAQYGVGSPEAYGIRLARHFVGTAAPIHRARVRIEEYAWDRIPAGPAEPGPAEPGTGGGGTGGGDPAGGGPEPGHSFVRRGGEVRTAEVRWDGEHLDVVSGLRGLTVMNTTGSEFRGYLRDRYTTLEEASDRILATEVTARWRHAPAGPDEAAARTDWDAGWARVRSRLLEAFAGTYSHSLQETLHAMGARVLDLEPGVDEVRLQLPNRHHFPVDLTPFGLENGNEVFHAADRPYGLIEGTVHREGAVPAIPAD
ncbi:urate oxidase [Streptacidiphilus sp. ASG 303]|uniref:factor-independent urate hydroxylase n=1 Tax=Streptacidiphilus sp. ASG 303 TaxID=2896847 RepID=UPI001E5AEBEA|nr:urate oxidase [Streptacidiphilus sp. ASG 303]MCD0481458.1 urate oxidase [Streptacidiphilus sp. ASG 303]